MVAIKQELAPNSRAVRMEVGWGEAIHDPPRVSKGQSGGGGPRAAGSGAGGGMQATPH